MDDGYMDGHMGEQMVEVGARWRRPQRLMLGVAFLLVGAWGLCYALRIPQGMEIYERIDPNVACAASLVRLPGIGPGRAAAICQWREAKRRASGGAGAVFKGPADLEQVPGIGPKTVAAITPWLVFGEEGESRGTHGGMDAVTERQ